MMAIKDGRFNLLSSRMRGCQLLLTSVILLSPSVQVGNAHADAECPVNWIEYDSFCYWVQDTVERTYADAQADCHGRGAALTSINSATEQNFIFTNLVAGAAVSIIWLGLNDMANEGTFVWEDGNTFGHTAWSAGQPDNFGNEDCVQLYNTGLWNDLGCTVTNGYICKMKRTHLWIESAQYIGKEGSTLSVTVHREGLIANDDEVRLIAADVSAIRNTDYTTTRIRDVSFPSGTESVTITYDLDSDELIEDMESFTLSLILTGTTAAGTTAGVTATLDSPSSSTVFIVDCTAVFWIEEAEYIDKESGTVTVTVHREGNMANMDTITLTAADVTATLGVDYQTPSGTNTETVTFAAGDTSATVDYTLSTDTKVEDLETFTVTLALSGATDTNDFATIISPTITTVNIEDCTDTGFNTIVIVTLVIVTSVLMIIIVVLVIQTKCTRGNTSNTECQLSNQPPMDPYKLDTTPGRSTDESMQMSTKGYAEYKPHPEEEYQDVNNITSTEICDDYDDVIYEEP